MTTLTIELPLEVAKAVVVALEDMREIKQIERAINLIEAAQQKRLREMLLQETDAEQPAPHV